MKMFLATMLMAVAGQLSGQSFRAVNDTIDLVPGIPKTVNLLANDTIPTGDSVKISGGTSFTRSLVIWTWKNQGWFTYVADQWGFNGNAQGTYTITDLTIQKTSAAKIIFRIHDHSYDSLEINNISAQFNASGLNFALFFADPNGTKGFVVPKGSGKKTIFDNSIWIGGLDRDSNRYVAGERYRQGNGMNPGKKQDYYAGPVMDTANYSIYQDTAWNYIWNVRKTDIEYHKLHWQDAGYKPIHDILTWPGNGNMNLGEAAQLAPYFDRNHDGIYNPMDGDYPLIRGDQSLYFIYNDNRAPHNESLGKRTLKAEFHAMVYGWDMPGDSAFKNTLLVNYKIYNRSQQAYYNTCLGIFTDLDIGWPMDDYIGCDVYRGSYYGFNGTAVDGTGQAMAYGVHPPAQSVTVLAGPALDPTGADRPRVDGTGHQLCNGSVNGVGFGDGIPDNERMGLAGFLPIMSSAVSTPEYYGDPTDVAGYYHYLHFMWRDSTYLEYGGVGHAGAGGYGPQCRFMFPGESDTVNWGSGCQVPNGPKNWTGRTAGFNPNDIRGLGMVGPFTFHPGEMKELDLAYVFARDYDTSDTTVSVGKLMKMIDIVRHSFETNRLPDGQSFTSVQEHAETMPFSCSVYPNPAGGHVQVIFNLALQDQATILLYDSQGNLVRSRKLAKGTTRTLLDVSDLTPGLYLVVVEAEGMRLTRKLSVVR